MRISRCDGRDVLSVLAQTGTKAYHYTVGPSHVRTDVSTGVSCWEKAWLLHSLGARALLSDNLLQLPSLPVPNPSQLCDPEQCNLLASDFLSGGDAKATYSTWL